MLTSYLSFPHYVFLSCLSLFALGMIKSLLLANVNNYPRCKLFLLTQHIDSEDSDRSDAKLFNARGLHHNQPFH